MIIFIKHWLYLIYVNTKKITVILIFPLAKKIYIIKMYLISSRTLLFYLNLAKLSNFVIKIYSLIVMVNKFINF